MRHHTGGYTRRGRQRRRSETWPDWPSSDSRGRRWPRRKRRREKVCSIRMCKIYGSSPTIDIIPCGLASTVLLCNMYRRCFAHTHVHVGICRVGNDLLVCLMNARTSSLYRLLGEEFSLYSHVGYCELLPESRGVELAVYVKCQQLGFSLYLFVRNSKHCLYFCHLIFLSRLQLKRRQRQLPNRSRNRRRPNSVFMDCCRLAFNTSCMHPPPLLF